MHYVKAPFTQIDLLNQVLRHFEIKAVMQNDLKKMYVYIKEVINIHYCIYLSILNLPCRQPSSSLINPLSQVHVWFSPHTPACFVPLHWILASQSSLRFLLPIKKCLLYFKEYISFKEQRKVSMLFLN